MARTKIGGWVIQEWNDLSADSSGGKPEGMEPSAPFGRPAFQSLFFGGTTIVPQWSQRKVSRYSHVASTFNGLRSRLRHRSIAGELSPSMQITPSTMGMPHCGQAGGGAFTGAGTVKGHVTALFNKTGTGNRLALSLHLLELARTILRPGTQTKTFAVRDW